MLRENSVQPCTSKVYLINCSFYVQLTKHYHATLQFPSALFFGIFQPAALVKLAFNLIILTC